MIRFDNVYKQYSNSNDNALNGVSLEVMRGEFVYLVGASGSGKSTFLRLVLREERPSRGKVWVAGTDVGRIRSWKVPALRRKIGVVFQDFRLLPNKTVYQNVAFALQVLGKSGHVIQQTVPATLELVGLQGKGKRMPHELSGGEQQRVAIARACVNRPSILLADEPTGNLDPDTSEGIMALLDRINRTQHTTVVMATHDANIVNSLRRRVLELDAGELVRDEADGTYLDSVRKLNDGVAGRSPIARIVESGAAMPKPAPSPEDFPLPTAIPSQRDVTTGAVDVNPKFLPTQGSQPHSSQSHSGQPQGSQLQGGQTESTASSAGQSDASEIGTPQVNTSELSTSEVSISEVGTSEASTSEVETKRRRFLPSMSRKKPEERPAPAQAEVRGSVSTPQTDQGVTLPVSPDTVGFDGEDFTTTESVAAKPQDHDLRPPSTQQWSMARPTPDSGKPEDDTELPNVPDGQTGRPHRAGRTSTAVSAAFAAATPGSETTSSQTPQTPNKTDLADQTLPRPQGTNQPARESDPTTTDRASRLLPRPRPAHEQHDTAKHDTGQHEADAQDPEQISLDQQSDDQAPAGKE